MNISTESRNLIKSEQWRQFLESTAAALQINLVFLICETKEKISVCDACPFCGAEVEMFSESSGLVLCGGEPDSQKNETDGVPCAEVFQLRGKYMVIVRDYPCCHEKDGLALKEKAGIAENLIDNFLEILLRQWSGSSLETELQTLHQINHIVLSMLRGDHKALERMVDLILSAAVIMLDAEGSWLEYDDGGGRTLLTKGYFTRSAADRTIYEESVTAQIQSPAVQGTLGVTMTTDDDRGTAFLDFMVQECIIAFEINSLMQVMESKLNIILGAMDNLVLLIDKNRRICYANPSACRILEMKIQELIGLPADAIDAPWNTSVSLAPGKVSKGIKDSMTVHDMFRLVDWETYPLTGGENIPGWLVVASDRSDYYRLQEMGERVERVVNTSNLLTVMAHEIRNPLSSIKGLFQLLKIKNVSPEMLQYLDIGINEVKRLTLLLNDFLVLGRTSVMTAEVVDFNEFLEDLMALLKMEFSGIEFDIELDDEAEFPVEIDRQQMTQVIINIVKNSYEAMEQKGKITFSLCRLGCDRIKILIRDTGTGVSDNIVEKMFTPYFTSKINGTGLGLAIVRTIIQNHCGEITVYNHPEGGACFSIILPAYQAVSNGRTAEIMLISDDDMFTVPLKRLLEPFNLRVFPKTGADYIKFNIARVKPAVLIIDGDYIDQNMLDSVTDSILLDYTSVKLVVVGAASRSQTRENLYYIQKPVNYPKIVHLIRSIVDEYN